VWKGVAVRLVVAHGLGDVDLDFERSVKAGFCVGYVDGGTPGHKEDGIPCDDEDETEIVEVLENVGKSKDVTRFSNDGSVEADSRSLVRLVGTLGFMGDLTIHKSI